MRRAIIFLSFVILGACVEPFEASVPDGARPLTVDGLITDQPGPYSVDIFRSSKLTSPYEKREYIDDATVTIYDDEGFSEQLTRTSSGHYQTATAQGVVGRTYHINIALSNGTTYESNPETILPAGDFSNLRTTFNMVLDANSENFDKPSNGFNVYLNADLPAEANGRVRWRWTGTYEIRTFPELRTKPLTPGGPVPVFLPDPPPCSGWVVPNPRGAPKIMEQTGPCTCCFCWVDQYSGAPLLSNKKFTGNSKVNDLLVAYVPASRRFFYDKYYIDVEQMSLSESAYGFWKEVENQNNQSSDLFQTPGAATSGNIRLTSASGEPVMGIFGASGIAKHSYAIEKNTQIPYSIPTMDTVALSCLEIYKYSSSTQPDFW